MSFGKKDKMNEMLIWILFIILSLSVSFVLGHSHLIYVNGDWLFHASRAEEIYRNLKSRSIFTFIATRTFQHTGVGSFLFYPSVFLYPWAVLRLMLSPIKSYYLWYSLVTFCALGCAYWSMKRFSGSKKKALVFALLYVFNPYRLNNGNSVLGEFIAVTFLPLLFLALYEVLWGNYHSWRLLAVAGTLIMYSHILSVFLSLQFVVALIVTKLIVNHRLELVRLRSLLLSGILASILSAPIIVPFLTDFIGKNIFSAFPGMLIIPSFKDFLVNSFSNQAYLGIGFVLLITLFLGWQLVETRKDLVLYIFAWMSVILSTSLFPWRLLNGTFFANVQLSYRYLTYATLFLSVLLTKIFDLSIIKENTTYIFKGIFSYITLLITVVGFFMLSNWSVLNANPVFLKKPLTLTQLNGPVAVNNNNYECLFDYIMQYGEYDYYPLLSRGTTSANGQSANSYSIISNQVKIGNKFKQLKPDVGPNQIKYKITIKEKNNIDLPTIIYNHTKVYVDGKERRFRLSSRGTPLLNLDKGKHSLTVKYSPAVVYYFSVILSFIGWIYLLIFKLKTRREI